MNRVLFWTTLTLALLLLGLVLVAPLLDSGERILALFAHDTTLRQTSLASALGLAVTAFLCFREPRRRGSRRGGRGARPGAPMGA